MEISTHTAKGVDKVKRYGWTMKDKPGTLTMLQKDVLQIHPAYQRELVGQKVRNKCSGMVCGFACGVLIVGKRDGKYWVIDGQHRAMAANDAATLRNCPA